MFSRFQRLDRYSDLVALLAALVLLAALAIRTAPVVSPFEAGARLTPATQTA